jgi:hypothetical protein
VSAPTFCAVSSRELVAASISSMVVVNAQSFKVIPPKKKICQKSSVDAAAKWAQLHTLSIDIILSIMEANVNRCFHHISSKFLYPPTGDFCRLCTLTVV